MAFVRAVWVMLNRTNLLCEVFFVSLVRWILTKEKNLYSLCVCTLQFGVRKGEGEQNNMLVVLRK